MTLLAMHLTNEPLSLPVAAATMLLACGAVALAASRSRRTVPVDRWPLMGVMGAFVFAAQMINFPLPGLPTSGHLCGAVLLAILLGPWAAIVTMAAILIIQCLLFQDGGLLALGCNIINMGVVPSILGYWIFRAIGGAAASPRRRYLACYVACVVAVTAGAALVPVEAGLSGVLSIPTLDFLAVMLGVHVLIGLFEGLITFAVIAYLARVRPAVLGLSSGDAARDARDRLSPSMLAVTILATAAALSGVVSLLASQHPDGLEWTIERLSPKSALASAQAAQEIDVMPMQADAPASHVPTPAAQVEVAPPQTLATGSDANTLAGYNWRHGWISLAGLLGTGVTLGVLLLVARALRLRTVACSAIPARTRPASRSTS